MIHVDTLFGGMTRDGKIANLPIVCPVKVDVLAALVATFRREDLVVTLELREGLRFTNGGQGDESTPEVKVLQVRITSLGEDLAIPSGDCFLFQGILVLDQRQWVVEGRANPRTGRAMIIGMFQRT